MKITRRQLRHIIKEYTMSPGARDELDRRGSGASDDVLEKIYAMTYFAEYYTALMNAIRNSGMMPPDALLEALGGHDEVEMEYSTILVKNARKYVGADGVLKVDDAFPEHEALTTEAKAEAKALMDPYNGDVYEALETLSRYATQETPVGMGGLQAITDLGGAVSREMTAMGPELMATLQDPEVQAALDSYGQ